MKEKIVNILVIVVMVVIANYPLYSSLKATVNDVNKTVISLKKEINLWKRDIDIVQRKVESVRGELITTIDKGLAQTNNVLNKINELEADINGLVNKVDNIKIEPIKTAKDLFKIE